uniref:Secreted protein n=1 Tax=Anopheles atroparvus TaxID=41427 RepID=A0AAG5D857_ANOAO
VSSPGGVFPLGCARFCLLLAVRCSRVSSRFPGATASHDKRPFRIFFLPVLLTGSSRGKPLERVLHFASSVAPISGRFNPRSCKTRRPQLEIGTAHHVLAAPRVCVLICDAKTNVQLKRRPSSCSLPPWLNYIARGWVGQVKEVYTLRGVFYSGVSSHSSTSTQRSTSSSERLLRQRRSLPSPGLILSLHGEADAAVCQAGE